MAVDYNASLGFFKLPRRYTVTCDSSSLVNISMTPYLGSGGGLTLPAKGGTRTQEVPINVPSNLYSTPAIGLQLRQNIYQTGGFYCDINTEAYARVNTTFTINATIAVYANYLYYNTLTLNKTYSFIDLVRSGLLMVNNPEWSAVNTLISGTYYTIAFDIPLTDFISQYPIDYVNSRGSIRLWFNSYLVPGRSLITPTIFWTDTNGVLRAGQYFLYLGSLVTARDIVTQSTPSSVTQNGTNIIYSVYHSDSSSVYTIAIDGNNDFLVTSNPDQSYIDDGAFLYGSVNPTNRIRIQDTEKILDYWNPELIGDDYVCTIDPSKVVW